MNRRWTPPRVTSKGPGIKGAPGSKVARYEKKKKVSKNYRKASSAYAKGK